VIAGRIAAVTMFANRYAVAMGLEGAGIEGEDISVDQLATGTEIAQDVSFPVVLDAVNETLDTGLSHHAVTSAWLGAPKLCRVPCRGLPVRQGNRSETILKMLLHPFDGGLLPQLAIVAAWAASIRPEIRDTLIKKEPVALLRGDLTSWSGYDRFALTDTLMAAYEARQARGFDFFGVIAAYKKLNHPTLGTQLRPFIVDKTKHMVARRARRLHRELLQCPVLGAGYARRRARSIRATDDARGLRLCSREIGSSNDVLTLMPLAKRTIGLDPNDELSGNALSALWNADSSLPPSSFL